MAIFTLLLGSCEKSDDNIIEETSTEEKKYFILKNSEKEITTEFPENLGNLLAEDIKKIKGIEAYEGFLAAYDIKCGKLKSL